MHVPPWSPSVTVAASSVTATVHVPAPSMSKTYVLLMPAVLPSARPGRASKKSLMS